MKNLIVAFGMVLFLVMLTGANPLQNPTDFTASVGTAGANVTVKEYLIAGGDGTTGAMYMTNLFITAGTSVVTTPDTAALAQGQLIYTFPAGQIIIKRIYGDVGLDIDDAANVADTPEIGLGTAVATGANATLGDAASGIEAENLWGPNVVAGCDTDADASDAGQVLVTADFFMIGSADHTVFFNVADTWGNGDGTKDVTVVNGARFIIEWLLLPVEGV